MKTEIKKLFAFVMAAAVFMPVLLSSAAVIYDPNYGG